MSHQTDILKNLKKMNKKNKNKDKQYSNKGLIFACIYLAIVIINDYNM